MSTRDNTLSEFIYKERKRYVGNDNNRFAFSLGQASHYFEYLLLIKSRHDVSGQDLYTLMKTLHETSSRNSGEASYIEAELFEKWREYQTLFHLDTESFYIFGKIFLDKIARFIEDFFGIVRGCPLSSHTKLVKNLNNYFEAKEISHTEEFVKFSIILQERISNYRDKNITHNWNPRLIRGAGFNNSGEGRIYSTYLYPNEQESSRGLSISDPISDLMVVLTKYIELLLILVRKNRAKTKFKFQK